MGRSNGSTLLAEAIEDLFVRAERFEEIIALFSSKPGSNYGPVLPKISHQNLSSNAAVSALCRQVSALVHGQKGGQYGVFNGLSVCLILGVPPTMETLNNSDLLKQKTELKIFVLGFRANSRAKVIRRLLITAYHSY